MWLSQPCSLKFIDFFLKLVFFIQWFSLHWEILIMLLSQFPLTFCQTAKGCPISLYSIWLFLCLLGWSSWSFDRYLMETCLLTWYFCCYWMSGFRLELMYLSLILNIGPSITHDHGFQCAVLLPYLKKSLFSLVPTE